MVQGRIMQDWQYATGLMAMLHNVNCTKPRDLKEPWAFDPYCQEPQKREPIDWARVKADGAAKYGTR